MLTLPVKVRRKKQPYLFIKSNLTRRNIQRQAPVFLDELEAFFTARGIKDFGPAFFRYNVIDHDGDMDMEFGYFTDRVYPGGGPVRSAILPAGNFMSLRWTGPVDNLFDVSAMFNGWAERKGIVWDGEKTPTGTIYGCRIEIFHVSPKQEADPEKWHTEVAIMTRPPG